MPDAIKNTRRQQHCSCWVQVCDHTGRCWVLSMQVDHKVEPAYIKMVLEPPTSNMRLLVGTSLNHAND